MREILFRGKKCNGEWAYGYYVQANNSWHGYGKHKEWIVCSACANGGWFALQEKHAVIPETVGQYTGLKDKNGKKIFEGDIVKTPLYEGCQEKAIAVVAWDILCAVFYLHGKRVNTDFYHYFGNDCEVIGNIHDKKLEDFENG